MINVNRQTYDVPLDTLSPHLMVPYDPRWVADGPGKWPYGAVSWAERNMDAESKTTLWFIAIIDGIPTLGSLSRYNSGARVRLVHGTNTRVLMTPERIVVDRGHSGTKDEQTIYIHGLNERARRTWRVVQETYTVQHKLELCPSTRGRYIEALTRKISSMWNIYNSGFAPPIGNWLGERDVPDGPVSPEMVSMFYMLTQQPEWMSGIDEKLDDESLVRLIMQILRTYPDNLGKIGLMTLESVQGHMHQYDHLSRFWPQWGKSGSAQPMPSTDHSA